MPRSAKAVALPNAHLNQSLMWRILVSSGVQISLLCSLILKPRFPYLAMPLLSRPQLPSPRSNPSRCWPVPGVPAALSALAPAVWSTVCLAHGEVLTSDLVLTTALTASTVWEGSLSPNLNRRCNVPRSEEPSKLSSIVPPIYPHLPRIVPPELTPPTSPFSPPDYFLSISVGPVTTDSKRKPGLLGAWSKFPSSNVVRARVGALMEDAGAGILVLGAVWKEILLLILLVPAR
jgi:hypothetical protein